MSNLADGETKIISGQVKWYDPVKGYGFIVPEEGDSDVLVHSTCVRGSGRVTLLEGARVRVLSAQGARGLQAREILEIEDPDPAEIPGFAEASKPTEFLRQETKVGPALPARVKWFDKQKGFGFVNIYGDPEDVFVHMEILRRCGFQDLAGGEAVAVRTFRGPRGLMAAEVLLWESVTKESLNEDAAEMAANPNSGSPSVTEMPEREVVRTGTGE